jgi:RNA-directed DNA polymerase
MKTPVEGQPPEVPARDKQGGEIRARWAWVEPQVWTERMLTALETGVKGNQWFSLMDKVYRLETLGIGWEQVQANAGGSGVDGITVERFAKDCPRGLLVLNEQLRQGSYRPQPVKRCWIPKLGTKEKRPLGIPTVRDRIVQSALRLVIEPIFERDFAEQSYGFRPGRGCKDALRRVQQLLDEGCTWIVDADLKRYFDTIPHERLMAKVGERIADGRVLDLIKSYLKQGVLDGLSAYEAGEEGTPQGAVMSPLLANIYLNPLDQQMVRQGYEMVRYADDFVILCRSEEAARAALHEVQAWVQANGLTLHPEKTRLVDMMQPGGFDFLGYHFERGHRWPRKKSLMKLKDTIRALTPRTSGQSLDYSIKKLNQTLRGWYGYFKHGHRSRFERIDQYTRGRLRAILRRRSRRRGRSRGHDHQKWSIHYFTAAGLFSLVQADLATRRSP